VSRRRIVWGTEVRLTSLRIAHVFWRRAFGSVGPRPPSSVFRALLLLNLSEVVDFIVSKKGRLR